MGLTKLNYVEEAENVIKSMRVLNRKTNNYELNLSTSKIRNILSMVSEIYNETIHLKGEVLTEDIQANVQYLKMRMVYEAGRDRDGDVKAFIVKAKILSFIEQIKDNKGRLLLFCRYMEALVAYHKFYGGRD